MIIRITKGAIKGEWLSTNNKTENRAEYASGFYAKRVVSKKPCILGWRWSIIGKERKLVMIEMIKKMIFNRGNCVANALMATGIIPCVLSMVFAAVFGMFKYDSGTVFAYIVTTAALIALYVFRLCNPITIAIGHVIFFVIFGLAPILPMKYRDIVFHYCMFMIIATTIGAVFYYVFGYKEKTPAINAITVVFAVFVILGWLLTFNWPLKVLLVPNPPKPRITYGEFPFTLVYEINGEEMIIEDTLICEYDGIIVYGGIPNKDNSWKSSIKSGGKRIILLQIDEEWELYYDTDGAATFMDSTELATEDWKYFSKNATLRDKSLNDSIGGRLVFEEELLSKYGIRIVSWDIAPPIVNSFK